MAIMRILVYKILFDVTVTLCAGLPYLILSNFGKPFRRGFFCNDESIRYPNKPSTISSAQLHSVTIGSAVLIQVIFEYIRLPESIRGLRAWKQYLWMLYHQIILFALGVLASHSLVSIAKYSIGRLRPNFIQVCQPASCLDKPLYEYIQDYSCALGSDEKEVRLSFFSGHASLAAYTATYISMFLQVRVRWPRLILLRSLVQLMAVYLALYTGFTRISDYKHHWSDVLTGFMAGSAVGYGTIVWIADRLRLSLWGGWLHSQSPEETPLFRGDLE